MSGSNLCDNKSRCIVTYIHNRTNGVIYLLNQMEKRSNELVKDKDTICVKKY